MRIKVTQLSKDGFRKEIKHIERIISNVKNEFKQLGNDTANEMRNTISNNKKRPGGESTLERAIDSQYIDIGEEFGFFVGLLDKLYQSAPYFFFINYGVSFKGMRIPGRGKQVPTGQFSPGNPKPNQGSFGQGRWQTGQGNYSFRAKKGITPMHYIEKTAIWLDTHLNRIVEKFK